VIIDFGSLVEVLKQLKYMCSMEDRNELRVWLFNCDLFVDAPRYFDQDTIFVDVAKMLEALDRDIKQMFSSTARSEPVKTIGGLN